ncbi:membrane-associated kinase regulator 3 [Hirschfeldia incana]|nr:membrane-associated kinase regulator 3 [Hirschfeldia incana]
MDLHGPETRTQAMSSDCDDDYIDMEVNLSSSSSSRFISFAVTSSPPHSREFEFQMCTSAAASGESTTSPADELFYKGQLLPLHLPPRLQMVQKLIAASVIDTPTTPRAAASSPRRFSSSEIDVSGQEEHCYIEISTELKRFIESNGGNSWSKKIKHSSITQKLKASRAYIRSLFSRPGCSDSSEIHPKSETLKKKKNPLVKTESLGSKNPPLIHRRSFSGVIQRHSQPKCSSSSSSSSSAASSLSSSFSFGSNGSLDLQTLMRSSNASSENSIEGAIEHCKQSFTTTRKSNVGESENSSSRTSVSTCGDIEKG